MNHLSDVRILEKSISAFKRCINRPCSHPRSKVTVRVKKSTFRRPTLKMVKYTKKNNDTFFANFQGAKSMGASKLQTY